MLDPLIKTISNFLFPKECVGCNSLGTWACSDCLENIPVRASIEQPRVRHQDYIDKIYVASFYSNKTLQQIIDLYKYHYREELAAALSQLLFKFINANKLKNKWRNVHLLALPLHRRRFLERGFNQSYLLADRLAKRYGWPIIDDNLIRTSYTKHQTLLNHDARQANIKGVFSVNKTNDLIGKRILLIDDVVTTGASLNEAARVLRLAGAVKIWGLVLAKN